MQKNLAVMVKEIVDKETTSFLIELPRALHNRLTVASLAILGLDQSWGRDHVKISDNGSAFFSALLTDEVKKHCEKMVPGLTKRALKLFTASRLDGLVDGLVEKYYYEVRRILGGKLEELAKKHAGEIVAKMEKQVEVNLFGNLDLSDPESFNGKLGEFALGAIAEDMANGKQSKLLANI